MAKLARYPTTRHPARPSSDRAGFLLPSSPQLPFVLSRSRHTGLSRQPRLFPIFLLFLPRADWISTGFGSPRMSTRLLSSPLSSSFPLFLLFLLLPDAPRATVCLVNDEISIARFNEKPIARRSHKDCQRATRVERVTRNTFLPQMYFLAGTLLRCNLNLPNYTGNLFPVIASREISCSIMSVCIQMSALACAAPFRVSSMLMRQSIFFFQRRATLCSAEVVCKFFPFQKQKGKSNLTCSSIPYLPFVR